MIGRHNNLNVLGPGILKSVWEQYTWFANISLYM
jgi:hypothetical protein